MSTEDLARIQLVQGNIVEQEVDAIVNAANSSLLGGGGVDGAIHRAAGPELLAECRPIGGCPTGQARITKGYRLSAIHVIHTVGPVYRDGDHGEPESLSFAYCSSLALARDHGCKTIAFPAISTGVYRYPKEEAAAIALETTFAWLAENSLPEKVTFVLFSADDLSVYQTVLEAHRGSP